MAAGMFILQLLTAQIPLDQQAGGAFPTTTKGDLYGFSTVDARLAVGTNGQVLSADSTQATGLRWVSAVGGGNVTTDTLSLNQIEFDIRCKILKTLIFFGTQNSL
jgi:hypothetical protein